MNSKRIKRIFMILIFGFIIWILSNSTEAAYVSVSPSTTSANPNQSVTLTISSDCIGKVNLSTSNGSLSANSVFIDGSQTVNVVVGSSGTTIVTAIPVDMSDSSGTTVSIKEASASISIKNTSSSTTNNNTNTSTGTNTNSNKPSATEKSSIATLSNLGIRPNDFSGFRANIYSYNVEVPNNLESIDVYASIGKGKSLSGTGTKKLKEGTNTFNVVVTAEDGKTQKTYTINVTRKQKEGEDTPEEQPEENTEENPIEELFGLTELKIEGFDLEPEFQTDVYEYRIELKEDIDKLDIITLATEVGSDIEITGNENLQEGENIITIIVKGDNEGKTTAYQIIVNKILDEKEDVMDEENENKDNIKKIIIISVSGGIILIIVIISIVLKLKNNRNNNDEYITYTENLYKEGSQENDEIKQIEENEDNNPYEEVKKKKRSKGKRFK